MSQTSTNHFDIRIVSQTISGLSESLNKLEESSGASKIFYHLLSNLRTVLLKIFDIYVIASDVHSKCAFLDPFHGTQTTISNEQYRRTITEKTNILAAGFKNVLEKIQNSIFMPYEHLVKHLKEPSASKNQKVLEAVSKASRNNAKVKNLAKKTDEDSKEIRNSLVAKRSSDSIIETGLTEKLDRFNSLIEEMEQQIQQSSEVTTIFGLTLSDVCSSLSNTQTKSTVREKILFMIEQNGNINKVVDVIHSIYSNPLLELKQSRKEVDGVTFFIPPSHIFHTMNTARADVIKGFIENEDLFKAAEKKFSDGIYLKAFWDNDMWKKLNESELNGKVTKAIHDLNEIYKEIINIFVETTGSNFGSDSILGRRTITDIDFVTDLTALRCIEANIYFECEIFPNFRQNDEVVRKEIEKMRIKANEMEKVEHDILSDVLAAIKTFKKH